MKAIQLLRQGLLLTLMAALLTMPVGCGDGEGGKDGKPAKYTPAEPADSPDEAMQRLFEAFNDNNPALAWDALPESYQKDVTDIIHTFAEKMDQELYDKTMTVASKAADVLEGKSDMLATTLKNQMGMQDVDASTIEGIGDAIATLVNSEIATLDGLKTLDVGPFVHNTGGKLLPKIKDMIAMAPDPEAKEVITKMEKAKVELVSEETDSAVVKLTTEGEEPAEVKMKKVEGKWIPADMAEGWAEMVKEAKDGLAEMSGDQMKQMKPQMMGGLTMIEGIFDNMNKASTQQEFDTAAAQLIGMMMQGMGGGPGGGFDKAPPSFDGDDAVKDGFKR